MLRILCLHGYRGSARILQSQMAALTDGLDALATFVCIDAPSLARGDFGWWHARPGTPRHYEGWQRSRDEIARVFAQHGPFDGVFGFSQGAALTGLLVGWRAVDGQASAAAPLVFDFAVLVGGFVAADPELAGLYADTSRFALPSMHIIGRSDGIVPGDASRGLAARFGKPSVVAHAGGHVIASTPEVRERFRTFLAGMPRVIRS